MLEIDKYHNIKNGYNMTRWNLRNKVFVLLEFILTIVKRSVILNYRELDCQAESSLIFAVTYHRTIYI